MQWAGAGGSLTNSWARVDRPGWEKEMKKDSGKERGFTVVLEEVRAELKAVAEGHAVLERQIQQSRTSVEQRVGFLEHAVTEGFQRVHIRFDRVEAEIGQLVTRFNTHEQAHGGSAR
jgi:hypothetical protein